MLLCKGRTQVIVPVNVLKVPPPHMFAKTIPLGCQAGGQGWANPEARTPSATAEICQHKCCHSFLQLNLTNNCFLEQLKSRQYKSRSLESQLLGMSIQNAKSI